MKKPNLSGYRMNLPQFGRSEEEDEELINKLKEKLIKNQSVDNIINQQNKNRNVNKNDETLRSKSNSSNHRKDDNLMAMMTGRLRLVESQLQQKNQEVERLKLQLNDVKKQRDVALLQLKTANDKSMGQNEAIREISKLRKQILEMEHFFSDYGLVWLGQPDSPVKSKEQKNTIHTLQDINDDKGSFNKNMWDLPELPFAQFENTDAKPNIEGFIAGLNGLSKLCEEMPNEVINKNGVHQLVKGRPIGINIFEDGFSVENQIVRKWSSSAARAFLADIFEGYYPKEFKERFPDGVQFDITDNSSISSKDFLKQKKGDLFSGQRPLSPNSLVNKLPKTRIVNGKTYEVKDEIATIMGLHVVKQAQMIETNHSPDSQESLCSIKIRTPTGQVLVIKLSAETTVAVLLEYVKERVPQVLRLRTIQQPLDDLNMSLAEAGLFPSATVFVEL
eukprot:TRINITY_DN2284_c0_g1_i1.p1 TRINITY_DN2284_c0_g1~~TRINITY_DN2284_c0_g1_i1.p1  ORF type:complete len:468 (+),score=138.59 TRINITY_DN2284_c0_g1_i1:66-1406(+)